MKKYRYGRCCILGCLMLFSTWVEAAGQTMTSDALREMILALKRDERGPYQAIRWFCPDGSIRLPRERCYEPGGIQHALHKTAVQQLMVKQKIYLGQILAGTSIPEFLDTSNQNLRMKQYAMDQYLQRIDDGWIMRRARFYRGAIQAEDEIAWAMQFLKSILSDNTMIEEQFFLLRQSVKDLPHETNGGQWDHIRAEAMAIADTLPSFMPLRIKIHGQPDYKDVERLALFLARNQGSLPAYVKSRIQRLHDDMQVVYTQATISRLSRYVPKISKDDAVGASLQKLLIAEKNEPSALPESRCRMLADLLFLIRTYLPASSVEDRITLMDLSLDLEQILYFEVATWQPTSLRELINRQYILAKASVGCGFMEIWEWRKLETLIRIDNTDNQLSHDQLTQITDFGRQAVQWGAAMVRAEYVPVVALFQTFEPLAEGFIDDRLRSSIILRLGEAAGALADKARQTAGLENQVLNIPNQNGMLGLNPGYAKGELVVVRGQIDTVQFSSDKIYVLEQPPADMKPVAGILTVSSGNLISHVQLLARNLGIPNADILSNHFEAFSHFSGQNVFFSVSPRGAVMMKPAIEMTAEEQALFAVKAPLLERIRVPTDRMDLQQQMLVPLRELRAQDSGRLCGPKAANLGELKYQFSAHVIDGLVIPFGLFRSHMDQLMPGHEGTYWTYLQETFKQADHARRRGMHEMDVERMVLGRLAYLRDAIKVMPLHESFTSQLEAQFLTEFDTSIDSLPVFIRSDTNMEDLKDFTGAGLNLTVFNVRGKERIYQAIRDVWASPYTERSYRWRQKVLENSEDVYPSILILPTVDVDKSGVLITTGVNTGQPTDLTVAFNRGPGGAVDGQAAETYILRSSDEDLLLSPARETRYTLLPKAGGIDKKTTRLTHPILTQDERSQLRRIAADIQKVYTTEIGMEGPFDIELGFEQGKLWLFQVRPYVENKRARSSQYLLSLDPEIQRGRMISLDD